MFEFLIGAVIVIVAGLFGIAWLIAPTKKSKKSKKFKPKAPKAVRVAKKIGRKLK